MRLQVSGHAEFASYGKDIVCAGVSALVETCILGIENISEFKPLVIKKDGYVLVEIPRDVSACARKKANIIMETILLGLKDISNSYPQYVQVTIKKEVQ
ncbi:MAG: uncharacterized protein PWQ97_126 [Tepidanaerobacteraceae bacterium]|nr:uncharacterized protein [Tepidanaerobacteraceae bacterium]